MTPLQERTLELRVGLFTLVGLLLIGAMVTYFGRLGEGIKRFYEIRVEYPNASGLVRGADVLMSGAKIGKVANGPHILPAGNGVFVDLKIYDSVEIPANSTFTIGSSGLLGDRFVDIALPPLDAQQPPLVPGATAQGLRESGFGELANQGEKVLADIREAVQGINRVITRLDGELLTPATLRDIGDSVTHVREASAAIARASTKLDGTLDETSLQLRNILTEAQATVAEGKKTMAAAGAAAREVQGTTADVRQIVHDIQRGQGPLGLLLKDRDTATNLRLLIANLRARGILFYRDRGERAQDPASE